MMMRRLLIAPLVIVIALALTAASQNRLDALDVIQDVDDELLYLPNQKLLVHFTGGLSSIVADVLWLGTIKYVIQEYHQGESKFTWLEHMCNAVTRLDPYFTGAYTYGGMLLGSVGAADQGLLLLRRGAVNNPNSPDIFYELAKIYVLNQRDRPEATALLVHYLRAVVERTDQPTFFLNWLESLHKQHDLAQDARDIWLDIVLNSGNEFLRELATNKILELDILDNIEAIEKGVEFYQNQTGKKPETLAELIEAGLLSGDPQSEAHGRYYIDAKGNVQNIALQDILTHDLRNSLNAKTKLFQVEKGRFPASLGEIAEWLGRDLLPHPYTDRQWHYDPATGIVS